MPDFTYVGDDELYYAELGVNVTKGDANTHTFDNDPGDGRWQAVSGSKSKANAASTPSAPPIEAPAQP